MADWIVLRPHPDHAEDFPSELDGLWRDKSQPALDWLDGSPPAHSVAEPTGRYETREEDGAVAEIYEVRPATAEERAQHRWGSGPQ